MTPKKTLFVSDLDGTLLSSEQTLSDFTTKTVNALTEKGMIFSYATARSYATAAPLTRAITSNIPVIVFNGTFIIEARTQKKLLSNSFDHLSARNILARLNDGGIYPIVYSMCDGRERFSYAKDRISRGMGVFLDTRKEDERKNPTTADGLLDGEVFHFTCIDEKEKLAPIYSSLSKEYQCVFYEDMYTKEQWLEIMPKNATKANAVLKLKQMLGCERVVCFGDGVNDISMFEIADECYAVENADKRLKDKASAVIGSNDTDGVAHRLLEIFQNERIDKDK